MSDKRSAELARRVLTIPRYIDAPWALLATIGSTWTLVHCDDVPLSQASIATATASVAWMLRVWLTCWRIQRGVSSLCPIIDRAADRWFYRKGKR